MSTSPIKQVVAQQLQAAMLAQQAQQTAGSGILSLYGYVSGNGSGNGSMPSTASSPSSPPVDPTDPQDSRNWGVGDVLCAHPNGNCSNQGERLFEIVTWEQIAGSSALKLRVRAIDDPSVHGTTDAKDWIWMGRAGWKPPVVEVVDPAKLWEGVILPDDMISAIKESIGQAKQEISDKIFNKWGLGRVLEKGRGVTMLFYGTPGTGKTLTAEAVAGFLGKKLKIVENGEIQSSEPGGAERAIKKMFDYATKHKQVLLFDECDSLLYNRQRVGMILGAEINCLLGEIERFDGVCIFTTNNTPVLDKALERRLSLKLEFPRPSRELRLKIWERMFPKKEALAACVDLAELAKYQITGGQIKNIVLTAARRAAAQDQDQIRMEDLITGLEREEAGTRAFRASDMQNELAQEMLDRTANGEIEITREVRKVVRDANN